MLLGFVLISFSASSVITHKFYNNFDSTWSRARVCVLNLLSLLKSRSRIVFCILQ